MQNYENEKEIKFFEDEEEIKLSLVRTEMKLSLVRIKRRKRRLGKEPLVWDGRIGELKQCDAWSLLVKINKLLLGDEYEEEYTDGDDSPRIKWQKVSSNKLQTHNRFLDYSIIKNQNEDLFVMGNTKNDCLSYGEPQVKRVYPLVLQQNSRVYTFGSEMAVIKTKKGINETGEHFKREMEERFKIHKKYIDPDVTQQFRNNEEDKKYFGINKDNEKHYLFTKSYGKGLLECFLDQTLVGESLTNQMELIISLIQQISVFHKEKKVHSYINPSKIMINFWPDNKIILRESKTTTLEGERYKNYSIYYTAPEWIREAIASCKLDIYALGAVLTEWLSRAPDGIKYTRENYDDLCPALKFKSDVYIYTQNEEEKEENDKEVIGALPCINIPDYIFDFCGDKKGPFASLLNNFLNEMVDPDPNKRPTIEKVEQFFVWFKNEIQIFEEQTDLKESKCFRSEFFKNS